MIKVLIVDDEYLVRERLKQCVEWSELGYEIAGEAANGEDALMMLEHIPAQLAIVDINMPIIDGLEFAQTVQSKHPGVKIIILTGYSSFEYAKTALQAGVSDYLLKPINMDELKQVLAKLHQRIEAEAQQQHLNVHLQQSLVESDSILRRKFIQSHLDGTASRLEQDKFQMYCPHLREGALFVIAVSIDKTKADDKFIWKRFAVSNIFNEIFVTGEVKHFEITYDDENRIILILSIKEIDRAEVELGYLLKTCLDAARAVSKHLKFTVTAGVGSVVQSFTDAAASYKESIIACKYKTIYGGDKIIRYTALPDKKLSAGFAYNREDMIIQLRLGNAEAVEMELHKRFAAIVEHKESIDKLYLTLYELIVTLNIFAAENKIDLNRAISESFNPAQIVDELETMEAIELWVQEIYRTVLFQASSLKQSTPAKLVEKAKQYIDSHYADAELDLSEIAGSIFVNPSYLSRIFKHESGYSVVEYLTKCRMGKAKNLMEQGCVNLYFIAESVGYKDTNYFSKCFKKQYSISPSQFMASE
ncbi:response regulator [Paenibacillus eucommiae]|uniref:Two-component system response regulator YesN n=1 Tax=Paenibacillus eucommiae TaxID=1355755 RepID=A0ABS4J2M2_9BACL|nr:response regulator [Paenibacillus eucommiae]MBP1994084.1 two-component system response regulator YesN [Paenibacillus eucommiae]